MTTPRNTFKKGDRVHVYSSTTVYEIIKVEGDTIRTKYFEYATIHYDHVALAKPKYIWMESLLTGQTTVHKGVKFIASFENKEDAKQYCHMMNKN